MKTQEAISATQAEREESARRSKVLVDEPGVGRSSADAPEIDGVVRFKGGKRENSATSTSIVPTRTISTGDCNEMKSSLFPEPAPRSATTAYR